MIKKIINFLKHGLWKFEERDHKPFIRWGVRQLKVFIFAVTSFARHQIPLRSAALTFYTLMSFVPIFAMIFGIAKGFGLDSWITDFLQTHLGNYQALLDQILEFVDTLLEHTKGGIVAGAGFFVLIWAVIKVFNNIEKAFNYIWEIKKQRSLSRKLTSYMAIVFMIPVVWVLYNSTTNKFENTLLWLAGDSGFWIFMAQLLLILTQLIMFWLLFMLLYYVLPNTKVKFRAAFSAGLFTGSFYLIFQNLYVYFQTSLSNYNVIYGSFAALPLFLLWLTLTWQIILFGAELSFAYQNISKYEYERESFDISFTFRRKAILLVMSKIVKDFVAGDHPRTSEDLAEELSLPVGIVREALYELEEAGLVASLDSEKERNYAFIPAKDINQLSICYVINAVDTHGLSNISNADIEDRPDFVHISEILHRFHQITCDSDQNILIKDL